MEEFDPDKFLAEEETSFDPDAFLAEEELPEEEYVTSEAATPSPNLFTERVMKSLSPDAKVIGGKAGPSLSETLGEGLSELTPKSLKKATSNLSLGTADRLEGKKIGGRLSPDLTKLISEDPELYESVKTDPGKTAGKVSEALSEIEGEVFDQSRGTAEALEKEFKPRKQSEVLDDLKSRMTLAKQSPTEKRKQAEIKAQEAVKDTEKNIKKAEKYYDNEIKKYKAQLEELKEVESQYRKPDIEKKNALKKMSFEESVNIGQKTEGLEDELFEYGGDRTASRQINREKQLTNRQKKRLEENKKRALQNLKEQEIESKKVADDLKNKQKQIKSDMSSLEATRKKDLKRLQDQLKEVKESAKSTRIKKAPLTKVSEKGFSAIEDVLDRLDKSDLVTGKELENLRKQISTIYNQEGGEEAYRAVRDLIRESSPTASKLLDEADVAKSDLNLLSKYLGFTPEEVSTMVDGEKQKKTVFSMLPTEDATPKKMAGVMSVPSGAEDFGEATPRGLVEQSLKDRPGGKDLLKELELNRAAQLVESDAADLVDQAAAAKYNIKSPGAFGRSIRGTVTKGQELLSKLAGTDAAKVLGKGAKTLGKLGVGGLGVFGATQDWKDAEEVLGIESPIGKAAYTAVEAINPSPISIADMSKMAPRKSTAMREAAARMYGLQEEPTKEINVKRLQDKESAQQTVYDLSKLETGASRAYATRLQNVLDSATTKEEYNRKLGMMATEPGFRKLMKKLSGEGNGEQD